MKKYTFAFSLAAHALIVAAAIVVPIFATGDLPDPPRSSTYVLVTPAAPGVPPLAPRPAPSAPAPNPDAAPLVEPDGLVPEAAGPRRVDVDPFDRPSAGIPGGIPWGGGSEGVVGLAPPPAPRAPQVPVRPGGDIRPPEKIHHVAPVYPTIARQAHVTGTVILEATIAEDGRVQDVRVLRSIRLLDDAAVEAVRQWRFTPTLLNRQPVRVVMTVTVAFTLR